MPEPGTQFAGQFELHSILGSGGVGVVYQASQITLQRDIALKILPRQILEDEKAKRRFDVESHAIAKLKHQNIVQGISAGISEDGYPYIAQELVVGRGLDQLLADKGALNLDEFQSIFAQVFDALEFAHGLGVVHRDLKPSNIMITDDGQVKIVDFGLAKILNPESSGATFAATQTMAVAGSPAYMSPEQAKAQVVDARSDLYSVAVLMFECLSAKKLFSGDSSMQVMYKHMNDAPPELNLTGSSSNLNPAALNSVLQKGLSKDPSDRYQSAKDLREAALAALKLTISVPKRASGWKPVIVAVFLLASLVFAVFIFATRAEQKPAGKLIKKAILYSPKSIGSVTMLLQYGKRFRADAAALRVPLSAQGELLQSSIKAYDQAIEGLRKKPDAYLHYTALMGKFKSEEQFLELLPHSQVESAEIERTKRKLLESATELLEPDWNYERAFVLRELGNLCYRQGDNSGAEKYWTEAQKLKESKPDMCSSSCQYWDTSLLVNDDVEAVPKLYAGLADLAARRKDLKNQELYLKKFYNYLSQAEFERKLADVVFCPTACKYGQLLLTRGQKEKARTVASKVLELVNVPQNTSKRGRARDLVCLAELFEHLGDTKKERDCLERSLSYFKEHPEDWEKLDEYKRCLSLQKRLKPT